MNNIFEDGMDVFFYAVILIEIVLLCVVIFVKFPKDETKTIIIEDRNDTIVVKFINDTDEKIYRLVDENNKVE